jgi:S1-C subfamily serine protease
MSRYLLPVVVLAVAALAGTASAVGRAHEPRPDPRGMSAAPSYVQRVESSLVALRVTATVGSASSARLGRERFGTAVIFDPRGYAVTVSYIALDAERIRAQTRDGRTVPARLVGTDLETGLAVVHLEKGAPWPAVELGSSADVTAGARTGSVGVDEDNDLVYAMSSVQAVRRFSAFWEYMLDRAFIVAPAIPSWGGSAVVDERGRLVGIASLRLGEPPHVNLAIPIEKFVAVKDELIATGRVVSRRPRPWLGLNTMAEGGAVYVDGFNEAGPAAGAGFLKGDRIVGVNGVRVASQEEFYEQLWRRQAGDTIEVAVMRNARVRKISVRSIDRYRLYRTAQ